MAFYATYEGGAGTGGLYVYEEGELHRVFHAVASEKGVVPGRGSTAYFGKMNIPLEHDGTPHMAWGSNGRLVFATALNGSTQYDTLMRWRASDDDLLLVSDPNVMRTAIDDSTADFLPEMYHPGVSDDGTVLFSSRYSYFRDNGQFALFLRGLFTTTDGETTAEVANVDDDVPEQQALVAFAGKPMPADLKQRCRAVPVSGGLSVQCAGQPRRLPLRGWRADACGGQRWRRNVLRLAERGDDRPE